MSLALPLELFYKNTHDAFPNRWTYIEDELFIPMRPQLKKQIGECVSIIECFTLYQPQSREVLLLVASVHPSVCLSVRLSNLSQLTYLIYNLDSNYQSNVFVCVFCNQGSIQMIGGCSQLAFNITCIVGWAYPKIVFIGFGKVFLFLKRKCL